MSGSSIRRAMRRTSLRSQTSTDRLRVAVGRNAALAVRSRTVDDIREAEFTVYSQFGEDGILQYLIANLPGIPHLLVEIGVQDYEECNSRYLVSADNWSGLVVDSGTAHIETIDDLGLRWRFGLQARSVWVTRDNVVQIIHEAGCADELGLLSLDIDGNDYWVLESLISGPSHISPTIVVVEYNSIFGPDRAVSVPYREDFDRAQAHSSHLYYGASLAAFHHVLTAQGYRLTGSNSAGNNAFFVRTDAVAGSALPNLTPAEAYVRSVFREARDSEGHLLLIDPHTDGVTLIADLPLVDVRTGDVTTVAGAVGLPPP